MAKFLKCQRDKAANLITTYSFEKREKEIEDLGNLIFNLITYFSYTDQDKELIAQLPNNWCNEVFYYQFYDQRGFYHYINLKPTATSSKEAQKEGRDCYFLPAKSGRNVKCADINKNIKLYFILQASSKVTSSNNLVWKDPKKNININIEFYLNIEILMIY